MKIDESLTHFCKMVIGNPLYIVLTAKVQLK